ncbi:MAG: ABC transporter permease [Gammaproteobacteria bacterium]
MMYFKLALRLLKRDLRSGELTLLMLALCIAVASATTISLFVDRLQRTLTIQAAEFLAGDLVISGSAPVDPNWLDQAEGLQLAQSQTVEFVSMLLENGQTLLASIKAVDQNYPLRGFLKTIDAEGANENKLSHGPEPGKAWVGKRVLSALALNIGDRLTVGEKPLVIEKIVSYEPDKRGDFYSFSPRVLINRADLKATGVIQPGSHVHYFYQFAGREDGLSIFKQKLKPLLNPAQRILDIHEDRPELGSALRRAERYLGLSSIVVILIAGVAIAMAAGRYTERHLNASALLRCLGCSQREIVRLYLFQFLVLGMASSAVGCLFGWFGQLSLLYLLKPLLPVQPAAPGWLAVMLGFVTGMAILLGFALPPLARLRQVSALRVLRRELAPLPTRAWLIYGLAITLTTVLIWRHTTDWQMTAIITGGGMGVLLVSALLVNGILILLGKWLSRLGITWRFGVQGIVRNRKAAVGQVLAFSVTLAAMSLSFDVRSHLIERWQRQLPERAPNHFVLNIIPEHLPGFVQFLKKNTIESSRFYPIVRGRLVAVNGDAVQKRVGKDSRGEGATQRDLSLTWAKELPEDNLIADGGAWPGDQTGWVSVEERLAENLGIDVGDTLLFTIGSAQVSAKVANLRRLDWDTMKPNFYMIFSPGTLEGFPATYLTSFFLAEGQKALLNHLVKSFPAVTVLEVDQILRQLKSMLKQLTEAVDLLLYFALLAGFLVLFASVYASLDQRVYVGALMRTLGARRDWLRKIHLIEFGVLGSLAGLLAIVITQALVFALYTQVMHINFRAPGLGWMIMPIAGAVSVAVVGYLGVGVVVKRSPMSILRGL